MTTGARRQFMGALVTAIAVTACSLPWTSSGPRASSTRVAATVYALQTLISASPTLEATRIPAVATTLPPPPPIAPARTPLSTPAPTLVTVAETTLCWTGPGPAYPVVSGIKAGTQVRLLGVGSIRDWFVVENPIYRDRCWIQARSLTLDPSFNYSGMQVYNPPPTPGPSVTPGPTPTS